MIGTLRSHWQELRSAFWALPGLITVFMIGLAIVLIEIDRTSGPEGIDWAFHGDAEAARGILSTIAGSLITVAGLSFSITIVTLQLVAGQFTPRAIRGFLSDRVNQSVAGGFVGMFAYCLIVLRSVRAEDPDGTNGFVPALAVSSSIGLALVALGLLLLFIHHMGQLIQVSEIAGRIARETLSAVSRLYPEQIGEQRPNGIEEQVREWHASGEPDRVSVLRPGYIRRIDPDRVAAALPDHVRVHIRVRPGEFVTEAVTAVDVWPAGRLDNAQWQALQKAIEVESERDLEQDAGNGLRQLTDIAMRALSPGVNDPTTAVTCIGYLRAALERLAERDFPPAVRALPDREIELALERVTFHDHARNAFAELARYAADDGRVATTLIDALGSVAQVARDAKAPDRVETMVALAREAAEFARESAITDAERRAIDERLAAAVSG